VTMLTPKSTSSARLRNDAIHGPRNGLRQMRRSNGPGGTVARRRANRWREPKPSIYPHRRGPRARTGLRGQAPARATG
jgi:hypothetical protein